MLLSAVCFGTLAILAKLGYRTGLGLEQLLAFRFLVAAPAMWVLAGLSGQSPLRLGRRLLPLLLMGAVGYAGQAFAFFTALQALSASVTELILYTYPALVALVSWTVLRQSASSPHILALLMSFAGVALLVGGGYFRFTPALLYAIAAPVIYTGYIVVGDRVMRGVPPLGASAITVTGTTVVVVAYAAWGRHLVPPSTTAAWMVIVGLAVIPTMVAISLFLAALPRIGGARAALLSTVEPVVTVALAAAVLGDRLNLKQAVGAALVLTAVVLVQWPASRFVAAPRTREQLGEPLPRPGQE